MELEVEMANFSCIQCLEIVAEVGSEIDLRNANYMDIFSDDLKKQVKLLKLLTKF